MNEKKPSVTCVGEAVIELARGDDGRFSISCGGDTFNTAIYLARAGVAVSHATALGDDSYSDSIRTLAAVEGVGCDLALKISGRLPAICLIDAKPGGERQYRYWREGSPARELFELPDWPRIADGLLQSPMIYFTGITLSLYSNTGVGRMLAVIETARKNGAKIVFDGNFRPHGWKGDLGRARAVFIEALKRVDIALPAYDDEAVLWGDPSPEATVERLQAFGIGEIVVKNGPSSALVTTGSAREHVPVPEIVEPVDPMAVGDAFNAAYLAARLSGEGPVNAVQHAHRLAGQVIQHRGSIMPRTGAAVH